MKKETAPENIWKGIEQALTQTCLEVLGRNKHHNKKWITMETLDKIQRRENEKTVIYNSRTGTEKVKVHTEYTEANEPMKKSIKADKRKYVGELATTAKKATRKGNMKQLYDTRKKLAGQGQRSQDSHCDSRTEQQVNRTL
ncbi:unnamed protein product [Schistosoma mattheei]|uniref:Uncharacterized protein n=1 Tax=Schistosoma mattheei TaxID=31246 RepID=A0A3P7YLF6_9TREM|nr:unnamed protein product [Schistosoma mattheei]